MAGGPGRSVGRCRICGRPGAIRIPYANAWFCEEHFPEWLERRIRRISEKYGMFEGSRRVAVAVSGGKDSVALLHALKGVGDDAGFEVVGVHLDLGIGDFSRASAEAARRNAEMLGIEGVIVDLRKRYGFTIPEAVRSIRRPACSTCGLVKRYALVEAAEEVGADTLATGHNLDDMAQFVAMGYQSGDVEGLARLRPVIPAGRYAVRSVKPLFLVYERETAEYVRMRGLPIASTRCPLKDATSGGVVREKMLEVEDAMPGFMLRLVQEFADSIQPALADRYLHEEEVGRCRICGRPTSRDREICSFCAIRARTTGATA
ncbi:MAG: ATP-binding protein [Conexivisphaera sp.]